MDDGRSDSILRNIRERDIRRHRLQYIQRRPRDTRIPLLRISVKDERRRGIRIHRQHLRPWSGHRCRRILRRHTPRTGRYQCRRQNHTHRHHWPGLELLGHVPWAHTRIRWRDINTVHTHRSRHIACNRHRKLADNPVGIRRRIPDGIYRQLLPD